MTAGTLSAYRERAEKQKTKPSGLIVLELLDEIDRLRALWTRSEIRQGVVSDESLMAFGEYKGERLADVPDDYLLWWLKNNDRAGLKLDADFGKHPDNFVAKRKLKLYDYIQQRIQNEDDETSFEQLTDPEIVERVRRVFPDASVIEETSGTISQEEGLPNGEGGPLQHSGGSVGPGCGDPPA